LKRILFILFIFNNLFLYSQQYGNEWINYTQKYLQFPVYETGIHRLDYSTIKIALFNIGEDIANIPSDDFQIFGREKEIPLYIVDGGDGFLNTDDYIEFYAEKNDSWLDSLVYDSAHFVPDPYYSLFNDTIRYYLSWNGNTTNSRVQLETDVNYNSYASIDYCWKKNHIKYNSNYILGPQTNSTSCPLYKNGEGWMGPTHYKGTNYQELINTENNYTGGPDAICEIAIAPSNSPNSNASGFNHNTRVLYNSTVVLDSSYYGYQLINHPFSIPAVSLGSNSTAIIHNIGNIGQSQDQQHVSHITINYPHTLNFNNDSVVLFGVPKNTNNSKSRVSINNLSTTVSNPFIYVINNVMKRIPVVNNANIWEALIPNQSNGDSSICYISDSSSFINITDLSAISTNGLFNDFSSLALNDAFVIITSKQHLVAARDYGTYRSSNYDTLVIDIEELYHQFSAGIFKNPLSIRRFVNLCMDNWPSWPSHLYLIGKSVKTVPESPNPGSRKTPSAYEKNLVPSWGYPSSDNHLTLGLDPNSRGFAIPTGRSSVTVSSQVNSYLSKVEAYELAQDTLSTYDLSNKEWQKTVLHFGGSGDSAETVYINNWLSMYKSTIEDSLFGGHVLDYSKDPFSSALNNSDFQKVKENLEDGVSLITFLGHSGVTLGFSQNIDIPENWNNQGKYPMVIGLGCYTGDVHTNDTFSYSERIVNAVDAGSIGFISTSTRGFIPYINNYTGFLYHMISNFGYGQTIGEQIKLTVDSLDLFMTGIEYNEIHESNYNGMSLQGDPAIRVNSHLRPEIILDESRVWYEPSIIDLSIDTFNLYVVVTNIGRSFNDSIRLEVIRHFPNGADSIYSKTIPGVRFRDTISIEIPVQANIGIGINEFEIKADLPISIVQEQQDDINNNQITKTIFISSNTLYPIWPYDYAIIGEQIDTLRASTMNPFEPLQNYIFEIDTTDEFTSPFKKYQHISSIGGVVNALPNNWVNTSTNSPDPLYFTDSTVYFWRCSPDSSVLFWEERSFQYIDQKWGWGQSHFFQFKNNDYTNINYSRPNRLFEFYPTLSKISIQSYVNYSGWSQWQANLWQVGGTTMDYGGWSWPAIIVGVVDKSSLKPWAVDHSNGLYRSNAHSVHCVGQFNGDPSICPSANSTMGRNRCHFFFIFNYGYPEELDSLASFLESYIPDSNYIAAYSFIPDGYTFPSDLYAQWPQSLFDAFSNLGATGFYPGMPDGGFALITQKGNPGSTIESHTIDSISGAGGDQLEILTLEADITGNENTGYVVSPIIGPSRQWNSIYWEQHSLEQPTGDSTRLLIYGIDTNFIQSLLIDTLYSLNDSIMNLNNIIDHNIYPMMRFEAYATDFTGNTPLQLDRWQVIYEPVAELAVNPKKGYYFSIDSNGVQQGDSAQIAVAIENISKFDMDSLLVDYTIYDDNYTAHPISYSRQDSLRSSEFLLDTIKFSTVDFQNNSNIWITANPKINGLYQDQPEQFYFNNIIQTSFNTKEDNINPLLDVTFDGVHILDNDIISPKPHIVISLDDENPFLLLDSDTDTSNFSLYILKPNTITWERIYFMNNAGEEILKWFPATDSKNKFTIEYNPIFTADGIYTLKVQGRDKTNNFSGDYDYQINFEVITSSTISNFYNYPNPFSTKTHFVFTLTGSEFPEQILIQILNVSGKVVREIDQTELGPIKIGHNKTTFFWDGRDQYGDQLANGIYFYRVKATLNGETIEHRDTSGDHAFKNSFGKMYLMR